MNYTARQIEQIAREARIAAGIAEPQTALDLAETHLRASMNMIGSIAVACADPKTRLDAAKHIVALSEEARKRRDAENEKHYTGSADALNQLILLPQGQRMDAAAQMFAQGLMSKTDFDYVMKWLTNDLEARLAALNDENERLVRIVEGVEPTKLIQGTVN